MKTKKQLYFVSGLPRSGATVLMSLLAQNPRFYSSPISGLASVVENVFTGWPKVERHREFPNQEAKQRVLKAIMDSYHKTDKPVIFDKNHMWISHIDRLEAIMGQRVKIIAMVRSVTEIVASFETLYRKNPLELALVDDELGYLSTVASRAQFFAGERGVLGMYYNAIKNAIAMRYTNRILFVDYNKLVEKPDVEIKRIYAFLDEEEFAHDLGNIKQISVGKLDGFPGLHDIRGELKKTSPFALDVLGPDVFATYNQKEPWTKWI